MSQPRKKKQRKRRLPADVWKPPSHEVMEIIFGKRIMAEVDRIVAERSVEPDDLSRNKGNTLSCPGVT